MSAGRLQPAQELPTNGRSWWVGLDRRSMALVIANRDRRARRERAALVTRYLRDHTIERVPCKWSEPATRTDAWVQRG